MISVTSATSSTSQVGTVSDASRASLDYNAFLKLLMAQLKAQDPTDPVDQAQTLAQLASFSNVEQSIKLNDKLNLLVQQMGLGQSVQMIGHQVESLKSGESGKVASIEVQSGGVVIVLENGSRLSMADGVRVS